MKKYGHIFFDLDHTIWDFEKNSEETISELFFELKLEKLIDSPRSLYLEFEKANRWVWDQYHKDLLQKDALRTLRFEMALEKLGITEEIIAQNLSEKYLEICPTKPHLLPGSIDVLAYLQPMYTLHLISNGFEETTMQKVEKTQLGKYFSTITTPTHSGYKKPHAKMFEYALQKAGCHSNHSVMIGDDLEADVLGAKRFGLDAIYFNPEGKIHSEAVTYEIRDITELIGIL